MFVVAVLFTWQERKECIILLIFIATEGNPCEKHRVPHKYRIGG